MKTSLSPKQLVLSLVAAIAIPSAWISGVRLYWDSQLQPMQTTLAAYMQQLTCGAALSAARYVDPAELEQLHAAMAPIVQLAANHKDVEIRKWLEEAIRQATGGRDASPDRYETFAMLYGLASERMAESRPLCGANLVAEYSYPGRDGTRELAYSIYKDGVALRKDNAARMRRSGGKWYVSLDRPPAQMAGEILRALGGSS